MKMKKSIALCYVYCLGITMESYAKQLTSIFEKKFELDFNLPLVFMDTHYNKRNPEEKNTREKLRCVGTAEVCFNYKSRGL